MSIQGTCFCGTVRYRVEEPLTAARSCHCSRCRKAFSGAGSVYAEVEPGSFSWLQGESSVRTYRNSDGTGLAFCGTCGSTLCGLVDGTVHGVTLGCVDGDPGIEISMHLFVGSKASWDHIAGNAPRYSEFPPG